MESAQTFQIAAQGEREVVITRVFDAPRAMVFEAYTKPELLRRWLLGPPGWEMVTCEVELKVGGAYRYHWRHSDGQEMGMRGIYREVKPPGLLVNTESFDEPWYPGEAIVRSSFEEERGKTTLTATIQYDSRATRDSVLKSGMARGVQASYDRLAEILASSAAQES
jgi:uncharacterized protein YndB with AHSA1/START domain